MKIAAVIPAAGRARRAEGQKLFSLFTGEPLVRRVAKAALAGGAFPVVVVTGFRCADVEVALAGLAVTFVHNPDFDEGMGASLATGFAAPVLEGTAGALVMPADMPGISAAHVAALIAGFHAGEGIVRATAGGHPGHPVLFPALLYGELRGLSGDAGARGIIRSAGLAVRGVEIGPAALADVDTTTAIKEAGGHLPPASGIA